MPKHERVKVKNFEYDLITEPGDGGERRIVRPVTMDGVKIEHPVDIAFADFKPEWRSWKGNSETGEGETTVHTQIPQSTAAIPLELVKKVNVEHLNSIAGEGLASTPERIVFQGYSRGTSYWARDVAIAGVWMGTNSLPGNSMQPASGSWVELKIRVSAMYRDLFLRDVCAVLHDSLEQSSNTVISFAPVPTSCIFLQVDELTLAKMKEIDPQVRLTTAATQLDKIGAADFRALAKARHGVREDEEWSD